MINQHIVNEINRGIDKGSRYFYFKGYKLITSTPDNEGSFYNLEFANCIQLYICEYTTVDYVIAQLKFYNNLG